ncbi:YheU family protein [Colwelliaceae bacterium 6471]
MIIPYEKLAIDVLDAVIQEFVLREGTEYGLEDISLEEKIEDIKQQLKQGSAVVVFSELHQTVNIMPAEHFNAAQTDVK